MATRRAPSDPSTQVAISGRARKSVISAAPAGKVSSGRSTTERAKPAAKKPRNGQVPPAGDDVAAGSLTERVKRGRREGLEALRDDLAEAMTHAQISVKAQIAGQLRAVLADLDGLATPKGSVLDDLAAKRAARRATAKVAASAAGEGK